MDVRKLFGESALRRSAKAQLWLRRAATVAAFAIAAALAGATFGTSPAFADAVWALPLNLG